LCGKVVQFGVPADTTKPRYATIGGIIKVLTAEGVLELYAMTAGHIFTDADYQSNPGSPETLVADDEDDVSEAGSFLLEDCEEFDLELNIPELEPDDLELDLNDTEGDWEILGTVSGTSYDVSKNKPNLDWALVMLAQTSLYRPNLFRVGIFGEVPQMLKGELLRVPFYKIDDGRYVIVYSGTSGVKQGFLSPLSSFIMLGPSQKFTETRNLTIFDSGHLKPGDCGSWVIDVDNHEILGHIVASDGFSEAYVIPITATLRDMKQHLHAKIVDLAQDSDIRAWRRAHGLVEDTVPTLDTQKPTGESAPPSAIARNNLSGPSSAQRREPSHDSGYDPTDYGSPTNPLVEGPYHYPGPSTQVPTSKYDNDLKLATKSPDPPVTEDRTTTAKGWSADMLPPKPPYYGDTPRTNDSGYSSMRTTPQASLPGPIKSSFAATQELLFPQTDLAEPTKSKNITSTNIEVTAQKEIEILTLFKTISGSNTGELTRDHLSLALVNDDFTSFDKDTVALLVKIFDSKNSGTLNFKEFSWLWKFLEEWRTLFERFDLDNSGTINLTEFSNALVTFGYKVSQNFVTFLFNKFDKAKNGQLSFYMFVRACISLKTVTDKFKLYDTDRDGYITLSFEEYTTENLSKVPF
jgi:Ca2+-binding EF-hand superfamily protein